MTTYDLCLTLMKEESARRLIAKLVETGSSVEPGAADGGMFVGDEDAPSVICLLRLKNRLSDLGQYADQLRAMFRYLEIPHYSYTLSSNGQTIVGGGWFPPLKSPTPLSPPENDHAPLSPPENDHAPLSS